MINGANETNGEVKQQGRSLNTILLAVTLGVLGFISVLSVTNAISMARIEGSMVGRQEIEAKIAEVKALYQAGQTAQAATDKDLTALKMALAERGITKPTR